MVQNFVLLIKVYIFHRVTNNQVRPQKDKRKGVANATPDFCDYCIPINSFGNYGELEAFKFFKILFFRILFAVGGSFG